jgi:malonyl-CoA/methylmalonyl-CoA synthetase
MPNANLYSALRAQFAQDLSSTAIETCDGAGAPAFYTWGDLDAASARIANLLDSLALPPGSRVAVQVEKSVEALMLYLAVLRAGHVFLPLNTAYQASEMAYFIGNAQPAVLVCASRHFHWLSKLAFQHGVKNVFTLDDDRSGSLLDRAAFHADEHRTAQVRGEELAAILYTSGTTGRSKGAMLSHANLLSNAQTLKQRWDWRPGDVLLHALPIFHVHGLFVACHGALLNGSKMLWFNRFDAAATVARLKDASVFMGVPTLYGRMLGETALNMQSVQAMRLFISGSAPLLTETFQLWQERTGHTILERYGMSETLMLTSNPCRQNEGPRKAGTVGPALPGVGLRIEGGQALGGVEVRGPSVFSGYWQMPQKTAEEFTADGWFKTGDVGELDADGYLRIVGRSKDLIITGGYNVYPAEVEGFLNELPGVAESAVIGVPHPDFGEAVVAVLIARPGAALAEAGVVAAMKQRIAAFKVPKRVLVMTELPRNAMGKVQKALMRAQHAALFVPATEPTRG